MTIKVTKLVKFSKFSHEKNKVKFSIYFISMITRRACIDEDFPMFANEVRQMEQMYYQSSEENKLVIKQKFSDAILNCKAHMGADLPYATTACVNKRFVSFYQPRLRLLKKTMMRLN